SDATPWLTWLDQLEASGRAGRLLPLPLGDGWGEGSPLYFAAENLHLVQLLYPNATVQLLGTPPTDALVKVEDREEARQKLIRGWTEATGPLSPSSLAAKVALTP